MSGWKAKRFWKEASVTEAEGGFSVQLDGRPVRTPAKTLLVVPTADMAAAIAAEWDAQDGEVKPQTMPFTRSANAALDKVRTQQAEVADLIADYGGTDLLCYRAEAPKELVQRQETAWDPLLDWAADALGARLRVGQGVMHIPQPPEAEARLRAAVHACDAFRLTALHDLVGISGSLVIGFAVAQDRLSAEAAWDISTIDEAWQIEQWGKDDEAEALAMSRRQAFLHAKTFHDMCGCK